MRRVMFVGVLACAAVVGWYGQAMAAPKRLSMKLKKPGSQSPSVALREATHTLAKAAGSKPKWAHVLQGELPVASFVVTTSTARQTNGTVTLHACIMLRVVGSSKFPVNRAWIYFVDTKQELTEPVFDRRKHRVEMSMLRQELPFVRQLLRESTAVRMRYYEDGERNYRSVSIGAEGD